MTPPHDLMELLFFPYRVQLRVSASTYSKCPSTREEYAVLCGGRFSHRGARHVHLYSLGCVRTQRLGISDISSRPAQGQADWQVATYTTNHPCRSLVTGLTNLTPRVRQADQLTVIIDFELNTSFRGLSVSVRGCVIGSSSTEISDNMRTL